MKNEKNNDNVLLFCLTIGFVMVATWMALDVIDSHVYPLVFIHDASDICYGDYNQNYCSKSEIEKYNSVNTIAVFVQFLFSFFASVVIWITFYWFASLHERKE